MLPSIQSKFFTPLLSGLSLISMFFLLPHNAKAQTAFAGTGVNCKTNSGIPGVDPSACVDQIYTDGFALDPLYKTNLSNTEPGFLAAPASLSGAFWDAMKGDVQFGQPVNDWQATFQAPANTIITVSGTMAAEGSVGVALDGFGNFAGPQSLTQLGNFSVTVKTTGTTQTLDFIFTGCLSFPSCGNVGPGPFPVLPPGFFDPVYALLVDPSWSLAAPGTPLDAIPESVLFADAGVAPSSAAPEPPALIMLGSGLLSLAVFLRRR